MKFHVRFLAKLMIFTAVTLFYCEYLIYYVVIFQCSWPEFPSGAQNPNTTLRALFMADTHLLGPYEGHWFDKLRREWQMHRAFQTAITLHNPEVIFVLGDLFDEGLWCDRREFEKYFKRFNSLFSIPSGMKMYVVPGNHDVGFHYEIRPFILHKFEKMFNTTSVQALNLKGNYFILINSMAMEGDGCSLCYDAEKRLQKLSARLNNAKKSGKEYSRPIILQHFPMYRKSDAECNEEDEAPPDIKKTPFMEKNDCLSRRASEMIYTTLNPRAIFTGHNHHGCHVIHKKDIHEYTLSSFSWRNKNNPTFILAQITPENYVLKKCSLPKESTVIFLYTCVVLGIMASVCHYVIKVAFKSRKTKDAVPF